MPGGFQQDTAVCNGRSYGVVNTAYTYGGTPVTPSATANTKGSWTQLISSTTGDTCELWVHLTGQANTVWYEQGVDIGVGASGSEKIIAPNLIYSVQGQYASGINLYKFPICIPSGTRIAARSQANAASVGADLNVSLRCFDGAYMAPENAGVDAIGFNAANTSGTAVAAGNATKGSYAQLIASTTKDYWGLMISIDGQATGARDLVNIDIAIGASGSEQIIIPDCCFELDVFGNTIGPFLVQVPAGTRIAARAADLAGTTSTIGITAYGIF